MPKLRKLGDISADLEIILEELVDSHDLQHGEVLALVRNWLIVHRPNALEEYLDNSNPEYYYGPQRR